MTTVHRAPSTLHEDVLYHVFNQGVQDETLLNAALVCHAWTQPAQSSLYREVVFSPMENRRRDLLLGRSMRACPHLRRHVRRLTLMTLWTHAPASDLCDWIQLLPANCMREFHWIWMRGHFLPGMLEYPAVQTVSSLTLKGRLYKSSTLQPIIELPFLRSLSLELTGQESGELFGHDTSNLEHLHIHMSIGYGPIFDKLLAAVGPRLHSFRLDCKMGLDPDEDAQLIFAAKTYLPNLTRLDVRAHVMLDEPVPFLDGLVRHYPTLEHLSCAADTYSARMFNVLPPRLRTLEFSTGTAAFPHETALMDFISRRDQLGCCELRSLRFIAEGVPYKSQAMMDACKANGIDLLVQQRLSVIH